MLVRTPGMLTVVLITSIALWLTTACAGGERPVLLDVSSVPTTGAAETVLAPPPTGTQPLAAPVPNPVPQPSVDDALIDWARTVAAPYDGRCVGNQVPQGRLCSSASNDPNVVYLGPSATELWHIVTLSSSPEGFSVMSVKLAGS